MESSNSGSQKRPIVIVMVKAPVAGQVKTRLCPPLSTEQAAQLAACMAQDVVTNALRVTPDVLIAFAPKAGMQILAPLLPPGLLWTRQKGEDLGARMQSACEYAAAHGFDSLVMIGTDSPAMPASVLETAILFLNDRQVDLAICPTEDGGFSLIGLRNPVPTLFAGVTWSAPTTLAETLYNAERLGLRSARLPQWNDIDTPEDLRRLHIELTTDCEARARAPRTWHWLEQNAPFDNRPYA